MLALIFPRDHDRYRTLPILGTCLDGFVTWLRTQGFPLLQIRARIQATRRLDARLRRRGVKRPRDLSEAVLLACAPALAQRDVYRAAVVRSLLRYLREQKILAPPSPTASDTLIASYRAHLDTARGLAPRTLNSHASTVAEFLSFLRHDREPQRLRRLDIHQIEVFVQNVGKRHSRASMQHVVAQLRSFLRFLATRAVISPGMDRRIDTPRVYRGERLPHALSWETTRALLRSVDRSTSKGRRDYAMLLLAVTYGLRACEIVGLTLDDVHWRAARISVRRSKVRTPPLTLPLTANVGAALVNYLRHGRPESPHREIFLRVRAPVGTLKPTALADVFQGWVRRSALPIPFQGPHCLRHSLAVRLLRRGAPLKAIGDLLGHRSAESTCVYLRLHVEDLRGVALDLPTEARKESRR